MIISRYCFAVVGCDQHLRINITDGDLLVTLLFEILTIVFKYLTSVLFHGISVDFSLFCSYHKMENINNSSRHNYTTLESGRDYAAGRM